jgi:hypothetical protein
MRTGKEKTQISILPKFYQYLTNIWGFLGLECEYFSGSILWGVPNATQMRSMTKKLRAVLPAFIYGLMLQGIIDDAGCLLQNQLQMLFTLETFCIDFIDILRAGGAGSKPAIIGYYL